MKKVFKSILFTVMAAALFSGCTSSDRPYETTTQVVQTSELTVTKTVAEINALATATPTVYTTDDVIEAYVTSNDAAGNFYKSISFQTLPTDASAPIGFSVSVDKSMLFVKGFTPGRKVYIKLNGLAYAKVYGSLLLGVADATQTTGINGISEFDLSNHLFPSATIVAEDTDPNFPRHMSLAAASTDANLNTLVELDNVEFADNSLSRIFYDINSGGFATNHDIVSVTGGTTHYARISQYALFSTHNVPSGRGSIRGVMTKYNSDYQFMVRQESDFKLVNPRDYTFNATLNEPFTSYATSQVAFANYLNFAPVGTKKWLIKSGALEMSSYGGTVERNKSYFVVPVDMTAASTFKFDLKVTFYTGGLGLKVYRSSDYVPGKSIDSATLYDISSFLSVALPTANATLTGLTYNIPASVTGNGYFIFEYTGTNLTTGPPVTTTVDIDNIVVN